jgi:hypothetical protein
MSGFDIETYVSERDCALRSLDWRKVKEFFLKYPRPGLPTSDRVYEIMMHKCRLHVTIFTEAEKDVSRLWLRLNHYSEDL